MSKAGWAKIGQGFKNVVGTVFTKDTISAATGVALGAWGAKLNANATKGSEQRAIELERERTKQLDIQRQIADSANKGGGGVQLGNFPLGTGGGDDTKKDERPKWVLPVAIGGGVLVLSAVLFFALRRRN